MDNLINKERLMETLGISDDCVDCQHRLNGLCLWKPNMADVCEIITEMPSAEPGWIPVTERLPEPNEIDENGCRRYYLTQDEYGDMMVCSWNGFKWEQIYQLEPTDGEIVAWMPLPEPWRGEVR